MPASFLLLREVNVTGFVADVDPNTADPGDLAVVIDPRLINAPLEGSNQLIMYVGYSPVTPAVTLSFDLWIRDEETDVWVPAGSFALSVVHTPKFAEVAPAARVFAQITALDAGAPIGGTGFVRVLPTG